MKAIQAIIDTFSEEDRRHVIGHLQKRNRRGDTKNIQLFTLIANGATEPLDVKLYGKPSRNAYHALCKRLHDNLIDFIASKSFETETNEELEILKLLLSSRIFFEHKQHKLGFKTLAKAERQAQRLGLYAILTEIYHTKIQYTHLDVGLSLSEVIRHSQDNLKRFQQEQQLNMAYASIKSELISNPKTNIETLIERTFNSFNIVVSSDLSYKSLFQLLSIMTTAAQLQSNYHQILPFAKKIYEIVSEKKDQADKHIFYHIEIAHLIALTYFRNKDFTNSERFSKIMEMQMHKNSGQYIKRFQTKLILVQALNKNYTGDFETAINLLKGSNVNSLDITLTLSMCLFQQGEFKTAYGMLSKLNHSDAWYEKKVGWIWVIKKNIIELLLLIELDKLDLVLSRLRSFERKYYKRLKGLGELRVINFVKLVSLLYEEPESINDSSFKEKVENSFVWKEAVQEDIFVMSFYAWLKSRMKGEPLYQTTLDLVTMT